MLRGKDRTVKESLPATVLKVNKRRNQDAVTTLPGNCFSLYLFFLSVVEK